MCYGITKHKPKIRVWAKRTAKANTLLAMGRYKGADGGASHAAAMITGLHLLNVVTGRQSRRLSHTQEHTEERRKMFTNKKLMT